MTTTNNSSTNSCSTCCATRMERWDTLYFYTVMTERFAGSAKYRCDVTSVARENTQHATCCITLTKTCRAHALGVYDVENSRRHFSKKILNNAVAYSCLDRSSNRLSIIAYPLPIGCTDRLTSTLQAASRTATEMQLFEAISSTTLRCLYTASNGDD